MKRQRFFKIAVAGALALCTMGQWGCASKKADVVVQPAPTAKQGTLFPPDAQLRQMDAVPQVPLFTQLSIYKITVPAGTVSRSEEFWKHIDEHVVDIPTYELLYKNGVRVGVAAASEWGYLKGILDQNPAMTQPGIFSGRQAKDIELELKLKVPYQDLFYLDANGDLIGRTFDRCDNLLRVSFQSTPRKPGTVRLGICPVVRSQRERIVPIGEVTTGKYAWVHPEHFYELNLTTDISNDSMLVMAPSQEGKWPSSLGNTFLINDAATEQTETLLVFRPVTYRERVDHPNVATTQP